MENNINKNHSKDSKYENKNEKWQKENIRNLWLKLNKSILSLWEIKLIDDNFNN